MLPLKKWRVSGGVPLGVPLAIALAMFIAGVLERTGLGGKVRALLDGRNHVSIQDIREIALPALRHRCLLNFEGEAEGISTDSVIENIIETLPTEAAMSN